MNRKTASGSRAPSRRRGRSVQLMAAGVAVVLGASLTSMTSTSTSSAQAPPACSPPALNAPMRVTCDCIDPRFNKLYVDIDEQRTTPVPHRYVHGGFTGTDARFSFYFPPPERYA